MSLFLASCLLLAAGATADTPESRFSQALAAAKDNRATPEGVGYDRLLATYLQGENPRAISACFKSIPHADTTAFEIAFLVGTGGEVREALVWPETNTGVCVKDALKTKTLPAPPADTYWATSRVSFGR